MQIKNIALARTLFPQCLVQAECSAWRIPDLLVKPAWVVLLRHDVVKTKSHFANTLSIEITISYNSTKLIMKRIIAADDDDDVDDDDDNECSTVCGACIYAYICHK